MRSRSPPLKGRGRGGVSNFLPAKYILTPPLPLPYRGGERLRRRLVYLGLFKVDSKFLSIFVGRLGSYKGREWFQIYVKPCQSYR